MTRISGEMILRTPCCGSLMRAPRYASLNFMAWEYWTDGYADHGLAPQTQGLRMCVCGKAYLMQTTTKVADLPAISPESHPAPTRTNWLSRLFTWTWPARASTPEEALDSEQPNKEQDLARALHQRFKDVPSHDFASPDQLPIVLTTPGYRDDLQEAARRLYWWYLNMPHREYFRTFREEHRSEWPTFNPSTEQKNNMHALLALLKREGRQPHLEIAELHRELGEFELAHQALQRHASPEDSRAKAVAHLIELKLTTPARYRLQHQ